MTRWAMVMDTRRCTGCQACTVACKSENEVPLGVFRTHVRYYETGTFPEARRMRLPHICNHCDNPPCVSVCPTGASIKRGDGIVFVDYSTCIGCKSCMAACPYGARFTHPDLKVADKCTFCMHRVDAGIAPACVNGCQGGTRIFGDLDDHDSEVYKIVSTLPTTVLKPGQDTKPQVFYISAPSTLDEPVSPDHQEVI